MRRLTILRRAAVGRDDLRLGLVVRVGAGVEKSSGVIVDLQRIAEVVGQSYANFSSVPLMETHMLATAAMDVRDTRVETSSGRVSPRGSCDRHSRCDASKGESESDRESSMHLDRERVGRSEGLTLF